MEQSLCVSWVAATAKQITNVRILHKYQVLLLCCSCGIYSAHLEAPASSSINSELGTTIKVTPHFDFSKLIINLGCFQLVTRTYISVWTSSLRFPVSCYFHDTNSTRGRVLLLLKRVFYIWLCPKHLEVLVDPERQAWILGGPGKPNVISSLQMLPVITFEPDQSPGVSRPLGWERQSLNLGWNLAP